MLTKRSAYFWHENTRTLSTDASDIGLKPGDWPEVIRIQNEEGLEGVWYKKCTINSEMLNKGEDLYGFIYENASTIRLKIFND